MLTGYHTTIRTTCTSTCIKFPHHNQVMTNQHSQWWCSCAFWYAFHLATSMFTIKSSCFSGNYNKISYTAPSMYSWLICHLITCTDEWHPNSYSVPHEESRKIATTCDVMSNHRNTLDQAKIMVVKNQLSCTDELRLSRSMQLGNYER